MYSNTRKSSSKSLQAFCFILMLFIFAPAINAQEEQTTPPLTPEQKKDLEWEQKKLKDLEENKGKPKNLDAHNRIPVKAEGHNWEQIKNDDTLSNMSPSLAPNCEDLLIGEKYGFAIMHTKFQDDNKQTAVNQKPDCTCILKGNPELKGCADMKGKQLIKVVVDNNNPDAFYLTEVDPNLPTLPAIKTDDPRVAIFLASQKKAAADMVKINVVPLAGKTNCRLFSENDKYIVSVFHNPDEKSHVPKTDVSTSDNGDLPAARWDFVAVDEKDMKKGFFMVTREKNPRALFRSNKELQLKKFKNMDGIARSLAMWNFMIDSVDKDGNTRYIIIPQDDRRQAIAVDERTGNLKLSPNSVKTILISDRSAKASTQNKFIFWNIECIF